MATITLLDGTLKLNIYYDESDRDYEDDICLCFIEDSRDDEKLFRADESSLYLTPEQAALVILELSRAVEAARSGGNAT